MVAECDRKRNQKARYACDGHLADGSSAPCQAARGARLPESRRIDGEDQMAVSVRIVEQVLRERAVKRHGEIPVASAEKVFAV